MLVTHNPVAVDTPFETGKYKFEQVDCFKNLGSVITSNDTHQEARICTQNQEPSIVAEVKQSRPRWAGHVEPMRVQTAQKRFHQKHVESNMSASASAKCNN